MFERFNAHSKYLLEKHFVIDKDYKLLLTKHSKQSDHTRGGHNKEIFMLNVSTFKKFCLKAGTKKADSIHDYYIKLEGLLHEVVQEESRNEVWEGKAYQTAGGLIKTDFVINQRGKIVSKSKSIDGIINNKLEAVNLRRRKPSSISGDSASIL